MAELIDRQAAIDAVSEACLELRGVFERCEDALKALPVVKPKVVAEIKIDNDALQEMVDEAVEQIKAELFGNQAPTIEPRAKGEWFGLDSISDAYDEYRCPFCGKDIVVDTQYICDIGFTIEDFKFCLNCGADLRGENNG